jgi:cation-transporting P-type ATPase C
VLWLLNIGEYLQDLTLRRSRRAVSELLTGAQTRTWLRLPDGTEIETDINDVAIGDEVVVHERVVLPVDGVVADQAAITGEQLPVAVGLGMSLHAGSVLLRGRIVVRASAVGCDTASNRHRPTEPRSRPSAKPSPAASSPPPSYSPRSRSCSPATSAAR